MLGLYLLAAEASVEATLVRDTLPDVEDQHLGRCVNLQAGVDGATSSELELRSSVVEGCNNAGIASWGSVATIEGTVIRAVRPDRFYDDGGFGLSAGQLQAVPSSVDINWSVVTDTVQAGVVAWGSDVTLTGTVVRGILPTEGEGLYGDGITAIRMPSGPAVAIVQSSRLALAGRAGLSVFGAEARLETTALECNPIHLDAESHEQNEPTVIDLGGNACGCEGTATVCQVLSSSLGPPAPLPMD
jgi:hypothetical protein